MCISSASKQVIMILATSQNVTLFYESCGDKANPAMLLLHGLDADYQKPYRA
jgi:hypothetical protein